MSMHPKHNMWLLANYFITHYEYTLVQIKEIETEVWLANPNHPMYPIIRLTMSSINATYFEKERISLIYNKLKEVFRVHQKLLDIHTTDQQADHMEEDFIQVVVTKERGLPDFLKQDFENLLQAFEIKPKKTQPRFASKATFNSAMKMNKIPPITTILLALNVAVFVLLRLLINKYGNPIETAVVIGAYYKTFIVANYEYYRLLTVGFIHIDVFHILINSLALINLGAVIERLYKPWQFITIYLTSIVMGSMFVFVGQGNGVVVGASAGLFGLLGALLVYSIESGMWQQPQIRSQFIRIFGVNLLISLMPGVSFLGHLGGLVAGSFLALLFSNTKRWVALKRHMSLALVVLVLGLSVLMYKNQTVYPFYMQSDITIVNIYRKIGFENHAARLEQRLARLYRGG